MGERDPAAEPARGAGEDLRDPAAFRRFYERALPSVYGYALCRCGTQAAAEDVTQQVFMAAVVEIGGGRVVERPLSWIRGIARHKVLDHHRRQQREERVLRVVWEASPVDDELMFWDDDTSAERALAALASLPASQRAAIVLRHVDGLSVSEVAAQIGRSVRATESLLVRGRENFKGLYADARHE
jgi:RNA polymerase sigma-70 factor (ECF subfamily)